MRVKTRMCLLIGGVLLIVSACSSPPSAAPGPYAADVERARQQATTDFERQVLADGQVSQAEFEEAFNKFTSCASDQGVVVSMSRRKGMYNGYSVSGSDSVADQCRKGTLNLIEPLFLEMTRRPNGEDFPEQMVRCLKGKGLLPADFSADQFRKAMESASGQPLPGQQDMEAFQDCVVGA